VFLKIVFYEMPLIIAFANEGASEPSLRGSRASEAICLRLALSLGRLLRLWLAMTVSTEAFRNDGLHKGFSQERIPQKRVQQGTMYRGTRDLIYSTS
jgi:hypothetical protein